MKTLIAILLAILPFVSHAQTIDGDWTGRLELAPGKALKLVFHISQDGPTITMDSPDQGAYGLECEARCLSSDSVSLAIPKLMISYQGHLVDDEIIGQFQQGGFRLPLTLKRGAVKHRRPQTPQPPFPYTIEQVKIDNPAEGSMLVGTLTIPEGATAATPIVVMVSGSGQQNRDEELFEHRPFAVIADFLARRGIASLRYDDRGVGESTGDNTAATTRSYASDAAAVMQWLRDRGGFGKAGILGHSEGGSIAYMLAAADDGPDFIVSIAGPSVIGSDIIDYQNEQVLLQQGMTPEQAHGYAVMARQRLEADQSNAWMRYFLKYDPAEDLQRINVPALIIYGENDRQVPPSLNLETARRLAPKATVLCYPVLNHLMQHSVTGLVAEYPEIEETIAPEVLTDIATFILSL